MARLDLLALLDIDDAKSVLRGLQRCWARSRAQSKALRRLKQQTERELSLDEMQRRVNRRKAA